MKVRLRPEVVERLKAQHSAYGELSRVVGWLIEQYLKGMPVELDREEK